MARMRIFFATLVAALMLAVPATAGATLGLTTTSSVADEPGDGSDGSAQVWRATAAQSESVNRLSVFLRSGQSTSSRPELALYDSTLALKGKCIVTSITPNAWNRCSLPAAVNVTAGQRYWLEVLRPQGQGQHVLIEHNNSGDSYGSRSSSLTTSPNPWANGSHWTGQTASLYADSTAPPAPDVTPPTASFTAPTDGQTVTGTFNVAATASDNTGGSGVKQVSFRVDDPAAAPVAVDSTSPYGFALDTTTLPGGSHTLYARPEDNAGNMGADASVAFTVDNTNPPPPPPSSEPGPIAGLGYHEVFHDDFNTLDRSVWDNHIWYDDAPSAAWTDFQTAENGVLHLRTRPNFTYSGCSSNCYPINTVTTQSSGKTFKFGYFEARMKWTGGKGAWPGFWLYSYRHATNPLTPPSINPICAQLGEPTSHCVAGELDIFEGQGVEPDVFYGTVHSNTANYNYPNDQNGNNWQPAGVDLTADFHTYGMLWTNGTVKWYLDDRLLMTSDSYYESLNQPMFVLLQMWNGGWHAEADSTSPNPLETQVDKVSIWQQ